MQIPDHYSLQLNILGAFEIVIGSVVAYRAPTQVREIETGIANDKTATVSGELLRMERINRNFVIVKVVEGVLIGVGLLAIFIFPLGSTWCSVGLGLIVQGAALLVFDAFAHHRAEEYVQWLQSI